MVKYNTQSLTRIISDSVTCVGVCKHQGQHSNDHMIQEVNPVQHKSVVVLAKTSRM